MPASHESEAVSAFGDRRRMQADSSRDDDCQGYFKSVYFGYREPAHFLPSHSTLKPFFTASFRTFLHHRRLTKHSKPQKPTRNRSEAQIDSEIILQLPPERRI